MKSNFTGVAPTQVPPTHMCYNIVDNMEYQPFTVSDELSKSVNSFIPLILGISILILFCLVIYFIIRKLNENETLKYEFITIIAHKFRTPLTQVKWSVDELIGGEQDSYRKQSLKDIQQSNEKLIKLTGALIELTDSDNNASSSYTFETVSLGDFIRTVSESFKDAFHEKNIFFSVQCQSEEIKVNIDKQRMEFVFQTLLENAITYTTPGKNVTVIVQQIGGKAVVSVTDGGIGISEKDLSSVFSKFYRTENAKNTDTEGFGVGLYLSKAIVRRHKGKITVDSAGINFGSTFTVTLKIV